MARWKYERRDERKKAKKKIKQNDKPNNLSKKDEYEVTCYINKDQDKEYKITVNASTFHGHPKEFDEIIHKVTKELEKKHEVNWINILEVVTK